MRRRVPEYVSTQIRKVEPIGGDLVRLYFAVPRDGEWEDKVSILMPSATLADALRFAVTSAGEISHEIEARRRGPAVTEH